MTPPRLSIGFAATGFAAAGGGRFVVASVRCPVVRHEGSGALCFRHCSVRLSCFGTFGLIAVLGSLAAPAKVGMAAVGPILTDSDEEGGGGGGDDNEFARAEKGSDGEGVATAAAAVDSTSPAGFVVGEGRGDADATATVAAPSARAFTGTGEEHFPTLWRRAVDICPTSRPKAAPFAPVFFGADRSKNSGRRPCLAFAVTAVAGAALGCVSLPISNPAAKPNDASASMPKSIPPPTPTPLPSRSPLAAVSEPCMSAEAEAKAEAGSPDCVPGLRCSSAAMKLESIVSSNPGISSMPAGKPISVPSAPPLPPLSAGRA